MVDGMQTTVKLMLLVQNENTFDMMVDYFRLEQATIKVMWWEFFAAQFAPIGGVELSDKKKNISRWE